MKIYGTLMEPVRPSGAGGSAAPARGSDAPAQPVAPVSPVGVRSDSVEISDYGRSLSVAETDPERVAELRRKVYEGAYNSLDLVDHVARRIIMSGDL